MTTNLLIYSRTLVSLLFVTRLWKTELSGEWILHCEGFCLWGWIPYVVKLLGPTSFKLSFRRTRKLSPSSRSHVPMGIILHMTGFFHALLFSLSSGLSTMTDHALGAGEPCHAQNTSKVGVAIDVALRLLVFISMTTLRSILGKMYTDDPHSLALVYLGLPVMGLCEVTDAPQTAMAGILTDAACPQQSARIKLCSFYCVGIPVAILLAFKLGLALRGILLGLLASQISCVVLMGNALIKMDWILPAKRALELTLCSSAKDD